MGQIPNISLNNTDQISKRANAVVLAIAQGLFTAALAIDLTLTGLTGYQLAPNKSLATVPFAMITVAGAIATLFASFLMQRIGRRWGFVVGAFTCLIGGSISVWAVQHNSFITFCFGTAAVGIFQAFAQYYRLAAADSVGNDRKARVISMVLTGGVIAAVLGPALATWTKNWLPTMFAGSYLLVALLGLASVLLIGLCYRDTNANEIELQAGSASQRSLSAIFRQPISLAALANNVIGGVVMMFVMTAAPLAAVAHHHSIDDGANIIQWHLVGMYAPSFFAGRLINRFGMPAILFSGMILSATCGFIAVSSTTLVSFYVALLCLGMGWNFMFVGGTTLLAQSHLPHERARVQGVAELIRYGFTALATLCAGPVLESFGWNILNLVTLPLLVVAALMTFVWAATEKHSKSSFT